MVIKTKKGFFEVLKNVREALNIEKFEEAYLEEYFDSYEYIVGDIASELLRLKGFNKTDGTFNKIPEYLAESCVYKCGFFILRRIDENTYNRLLEHYKKNPNPNITVGDDKVPTMEKVNYDKENLNLESTGYSKPNIVLNMDRINRIKIVPLPEDLKDDKEDLSNNRKNNNRNNFSRDNFAKDKFSQNNHSMNYKNNNNNNSFKNNNNRHKNNNRNKGDFNEQ